MFKKIVVTLLCIASSTLAVSAQTLPQMRMTPAEIKGSPTDNNQIGSSGLAGVHTKVLFGDPAKAGFYSILLFVPAHVTIEAHTHRDNRVATTRGSVSNSQPTGWPYTRWICAVGGNRTANDSTSTHLQTMSAMLVPS